MAGPRAYLVQRMGIEEGPYDLEDLRRMIDANQLRAEDLVRDEEAPDKWFKATSVPGLYSTKEWLVALLLSIFIGNLGVDRFYVGQIGIGVVKLITCGGFGVWWLIDVILFAMNKVKDEQNLPLRK